LTAGLDGYSHAEVRSGALLVAAVGCLIALIFLAGNFQLFADTYRIPILFNYISGLTKNSPVHYAGHAVGKVTDIKIVGKQEGQIVVTVSISKDAILRKDSQAYVDVLGFMGEKFVELTAGSPDAPLLGEGEMLAGTDPIALNEIMAKGTAIADELGKTTASLDTLIKNADQMVAGSRSDIGEIFTNLNESSRNLKEMTEDLKHHPWKLLKKSKENSPEARKRRFLFF
jgi:phospholipid/cholesterol/gamma-HCH transport system substrate-binding protein